MQLLHAIALVAMQLPLWPYNCPFVRSMAVRFPLCNCPCGRRAPKLQGARELEGAGLTLTRCSCRRCGGGGRHGCHHLIPPRTARRHRGYCWVCQSYDRQHSSFAQTTDADDAEETNEGPDEPCPSGLNTTDPSLPLTPSTRGHRSSDRRAPASGAPGSIEHGGDRRFSVDFP